jgi:hypothetical protein
MIRLLEFRAMGSDHGVSVVTSHHPEELDHENDPTQNDSQE